MRFIVLVSSGSAAPAELLSALTKKGGSVSVRGDAAEVMVDLAQGPAEAVVLAGQTPPALTRDLTRAVAEHHAPTKVWRYRIDPAGQPSLTPADRAQTPAAPVPEPVPPRNGEQREPIADRARHSDAPRRVAPIVVKVPAEADSGGPLISEEELTMLLGPMAGADDPTQPASDPWKP